MHSNIHGSMQSSGVGPQLYAVDKALSLLDRKQNPVPNSTLPVRDTALTDLHSHDPNITIDSQAGPSLTGVHGLLLTKVNLLLLECIVLQVSFLAPFFLIRSRFEEACMAGDGGGDAGQGAGVQVEEQACQR